MRTLLATLMLALLAAPIAAAQESNETTTEAPRDGGNAWVEDCPPDMMCAANDPQPYGDEDCIHCSGPVRGPADGSCENCRGDSGDATCMDGAQANESCDPNVQYLGGPAPSTDANAQNVDARQVPGAAAIVVIVGFALAVFLVARRSN
jgi:hypothetical protein